MHQTFRQNPLCDMRALTTWSEKLLVSPAFHYVAAARVPGCPPMTCTLHLIGRQQAVRWWRGCDRAPRRRTGVSRAAQCGRRRDAVRDGHDS